MKLLTVKAICYVVAVQGARGPPAAKMEIFLTSNVRSNF